MKTFASKEAKDSFGLLLDTAQREPVMIAKKGRPVAVVISKEEYDRLEALEDAWWGERAKQAEKSGYLGPAEGMAFLRRTLNVETRPLQTRKGLPRPSARQAPSASRRQARHAAR